MEREVLFWVFISFFVLIGVASLAVQLGWIRSEPSFRKWSLLSFFGAVTGAVVALFKIVFIAPVPATPVIAPTTTTAYTVSLVFPTEAVLPSLKKGTYEYDDV